MPRLASLIAVAAVLVSACASPPDPPAPSGSVLVAFPLSVDAEGLSRKALAVAPTGSERGRFLRIEEIRERYGADRNTIERATAALASHGITDVAVDPTGAALWGSVEVSVASEVLGADLALERVGARSVILPRRAPELPGDVRDVEGVVGLVRTMPTPGTQGSSGPRPPCPRDPVDLERIAEAYGIRPSNGSGSLVLLSTADVDAAELTLYEECGGNTVDARRVRASTVPLTPREDGGDEVGLDVLVARLVAPDADAHLIHFDRETPLAFPLLELVDSIHEDEEGVPGVLAITQGYCELGLSPAEIGLSEWLLGALAAMGTTTLAAAGDTGSSGCHPRTEDVSVQYPASSAWATAIGGTDFDGSAANPENLRVWKSAMPPQAGGGGRSVRIARPVWQDTPPTGDFRMVPDASAFARPGGVGSIPVCEGGSCRWAELGGTSLGVAALGPILAGALGADRVGHIAPAIAEMARDGAVVVDVAAGDTRLFTDDCCEAGPGFDLASGWGLLMPDALIAALK